MASSPPPPSQPPPEPVKRPYNPGTFEQLHKPTKDVFPSNFEGARVAVQRALSNHFQVSHVINLSSSDPSGYRFGATYVGNNLVGPAEAYPVLLGDTDASGNVSASVIHQFGDRLRAKLVAQIQKSKYQTTQLSADYLGDRYTASMTLGNIDLLKNSGIVVGHYLHRVTKCMSLGSEIVYQYGPMVPNEHMSVMSLAGRYQTERWQATGTIGGSGVHACYYRRCNEQLQMGVEFETSLRVGKCVATLGYQVDIPRADLVFRGMVDTDWSVGSSLEKKLQPLPFTLAMSGLYNHAENAFRMGIAFFVG